MIHLIVSILIGALAGYIAGRIMGSEGSFLHNLVLGVIGGVVGSLLLGLVGIASGRAGRLRFSVCGAAVFPLTKTDIKRAEGREISLFRPFFPLAKLPP